MKRTLIFILLAALLLAGCTETPQEPPVPTPAPTPTTAPTPTQAPTPSPTPDVSAENFTVHTDYSLYAPAKPVEPVYTRLRGEHIPDLLPSEDYGLLYPFTSGPLYTPDGYAAGVSYGLFDETGRIVADPTYSRVEAPSYNDERLGWLYAPVLSLMRYDGSGAAKYALAALDGSFVTGLDYGVVQGLPFGALCAETRDGAEFVIYAADGRVIMTQDDLGGRTLKGEIYPMLYGEFGAIKGGEDTLLLRFDDGNGGEEYYFYGLDGEPMHGPWKWAGTYYKDRAVVADESGLYGVIDRSGGFVVEPAYESVTLCTDGGFICGAPGGVFLVLDADGSERLRFEGRDFAMETSAGYVTGNDATNDIWSFDRGGGLICEVGGREYFSLVSPEVMAKETPEGVELKSIATGEAVFIEGGGYADIPAEYRFGGFYGGSYDAVLVGTGEGDLLISSDLQNAVLAGDGGVLSMTDPISGETYYGGFYDYSYFKLYDAGLGLVGVYEWPPTPYNGYILCTTGSWSMCVSPEGETLFCYPLAMSAEG